MKQTKKMGAAPHLCRHGSRHYSYENQYSIYMRIVRMSYMTCGLCHSPLLSRAFTHGRTRTFTSSLSTFLSVITPL